MGQEQMISTQQPMAATCTTKDRKLDFCTLDGQQRRSMTFHVARVKKALGSVSQMVKNGNKLVSDQDRRPTSRTSEPMRKYGCDRKPVCTSWT